MSCRRSFYEDEEQVTTKPGVNAEISPELKQQESSHGNISFTEGMGVRTTPYLEKQAKNLRHFVHGNASVLLAELGTQKTAFANEWNNLKEQLSETILDPIFPGVVSLVFPVLAVNVFMAKRALPLRFAVSTLVGGVSLRYNMPLTYFASKVKLCAWEKENFPELQKEQNELISSVDTWASGAQALGHKAKLDLQESIHKARLALIKALDD